METIEKKLYTTTATSTGGRDGSVRSEDGFLDLPLKSPAELGGPGGATNPEQLFAAGFAACYHSALALVASRQGVDTTDSQVVGKVEMGTGAEAGKYVLAITLEIHLPAGTDPETAQRIMDQAADTCPYSRATHGNIEVAYRLAS